MSILAPLLLAAFLLFLQGPLLQFSCAFTGARAPGFGRALVTALLAGLLSSIVAVTWSWTFGLLISFFISAWLAWGISVALAGTVAAVVYKSRLRLPFPQAVIIAAVHHLLTWAITAAAWYLYGLF